MSLDRSDAMHDSVATMFHRSLNRWLPGVAFIALLGMVTALPACGDDAADGTDAAGDGDGDGGESPRDGLWNYYDGGVQENTCGSDDLKGDNDLTFEVMNNGGAVFTIAQNDPYEDFDCNKTGSDFNCPQRLKGEAPIANTDIVLEYSVEIDGTLQSATSMSGTQRFDIVCTGSQCSLASTLGYTFPCYYTVDFTAAWKQAF